MIKSKMFNHSYQSFSCLNVRLKWFALLMDFPTLRSAGCIIPYLILESLSSFSRWLGLENSINTFTYGNSRFSGSLLFPRHKPGPRPNRVQSAESPDKAHVPSDTQCLPHCCHPAPGWSIYDDRWTVLSHHYPSESSLYITVHSWCCTICGFWQTYNDMCPRFQDHTE